MLKTQPFSDTDSKFDGGTPDDNNAPGDNDKNDLADARKTPTRRWTSMALVTKTPLGWSIWRRRWYFWSWGSRWVVTVLKQTSTLRVYMVEAWPVARKLNLEWINIFHFHPNMIIKDLRKTTCKITQRSRRRIRKMLAVFHGVHCHLSGELNKDIDIFQRWKSLPGKRYTAC